ncbi:MAG: cytidine deaminase [Armatimonadaceae bacterium]
MVDAAIKARQQAYAPYSNYSVGAALLLSDGQIVTGCNVENASFGLTICAERAAVCSAVVAGNRTVHACVVATADGGAPCGACRQVLSEFHDDEHPMEIVAVTSAGEIVMNTYLRELLPQGFGFGGRAF